MRGTKKWFIPIACVVLALIMAVGVEFFAYRGQVSAESPTPPTDGTVRINTIGELSWDAVGGAEGYEWMYSVGGTDSEWFATAETTVDGAEALQRAVKHAQSQSLASATATFKVRAINADGTSNATTLVHEFDRYIDYGFSRHDISDVDSRTRDGGAIDWALGVKIHSALDRNQLLTYGLKFVGDSIVTFEQYFFGNGSSTSGNQDYGYGFKFTKSGGMNSSSGLVLYQDRMEYGASGADSYNPGIKRGGTVAFGTNEISYIHIGMFDAFDLNGDYWGDIYYLKRMMNVAGTITETNEYYRYVPKKGAWKEGSTGASDLTRTDSQGGRLIPRTSMLLSYSAGGSSGILQLVSGKLPSTDVDAPSYVYYDNENGELRWNRVSDATGYQYAYGSSDWIDVDSDRVNITAIAEEYIANYATSGVSALRFRVRAVDASGNYSRTESYNFNLKAFYNRRSSVRDISVVHPATPFTSPTEEKTGATDGSTLGTGTNLTVNSYIEMAFRATKETYKGNPRVLISTFTTTATDAKSYAFTLFPDGYVLISQGTNATTYDTNLQSWQRVRLAPKFENGKKYFVCLGTDELFDINSPATKVADRLTIKVSVEEGSYRRVLGVVTYDNYQFDDKDITHNYDANSFLWFRYDGGYNVTENGPLFYFMPSRFNREYSVVPNALGVDLVSETLNVKYGQEYNLNTAFSKIYSASNGITGWYYLNSLNEEVELEANSFWNIDVPQSNGEYILHIFAKTDNEITSNSFSLTAQGSNEGDLLGVDYTVNNAEYTFTDEVILLEPANIPSSYKFYGWYLEETFETKVTKIPAGTLQSTTIYAKVLIKIATSITVNTTQETEYNSQEQAISGITVTDNLTPTITYYTNELCTEEVGGLPVNAGVYYVKITVAGNEEYIEATPVVVTFTINRVTPVITAETEQTVDYNGTQRHTEAFISHELALVITYYPTEADRTANTNGNTSAPINAGTYYVRAGYEGCVNYNEVYLDITLIVTAPPVVPTYTVTFNTGGGTEVDAVSGIDAHSVITMPTAPTKQNSIFVGWFKDETFTEEWDFDNDVVTADITLYAKWQTIEAPKGGCSGNASGTITLIVMLAIGCVIKRRVH